MKSPMIGIIILAAGESSRMSGSKQLLKNGTHTLLRQSVLKALPLGLPVATVLGSNYEEHKNQIDDLNTEVFFNLDWKKGMGNSLKFGLEHMNKINPGLDGFMFMVCDQPLLTKNLLSKLINKFYEGHPIVACSYEGVRGVPVLFSRKYFKELMKIPDNQGAQILVKKYGTADIDFPNGMVDIDTDKDWRNFMEEKHE